MKHNSVPDSLVMRSLREGLCSETSSRSRQQPKENAQRPSCIVRAVFDKNDLVFRYNRKFQALSLIEAEYLLSTPHEYTDVYIFLDKKDEAGNFFCRSFFPKEDRDYTKGQAVYTLLKKEKIKIDPAQTATEQPASHSVVFLSQ